MTIRQTIAQWFYSPGAYGLWLALDDVENWSAARDTDYILYRRTVDRSGYDSKYRVCMRVSGGASKFDGACATPKFTGWFERRLLWRKYKSLNNRRVLFYFTRLEDPK